MVFFNYNLAKPSIENTKNIKFGCFKFAYEFLKGFKAKILKFYLLE